MQSFPVRAGALAALAAFGLAAFGLAAAQPAAAQTIATIPPNLFVPPINATFSGTGTVGPTTVGGYDTQFLGTSTSVMNVSIVTFTSESLSLYYTPTGFTGLALPGQPDSAPVMNSFIGTDDLVAQGEGTVDLSLAGMFTGPTGAIGTAGGATLTFTGTATVTGGTLAGTLGLIGSTKFSTTETETTLAGPAPGSVFAPAGDPNQQPAGPASYTVSYGTVTPAAVPEASTTVSFGLLLILALGGLVIVAKRKRQSA